MSTYIIGDLHGHYRDYERLLIESGLCSDDLEWTGGTNRLWLIGDFFDRGASGVKCVELTMSLQKKAAVVGGFVNSILGNHELMILCAFRFRDQITDQGISVVDQWLRWGGIESDLQTLDSIHTEWLEQLPAMAIEGDALLLHADAMIYVDHGMTIDTVNESFARLMQSDDLKLWERTLSMFGEHMAFCSLNITGTRRVQQLLAMYGGSILVHGHTPIPYARQVEPDSVKEAWYYADDKCVNVDGGMYMGGPGFVYQLS
jgi:hypothetical protein